MLSQIRKSIHRNRKRARADCPMRVGHADDIEQQRHGQNRPAAADQPQREANETAGQERENILNQVGFPCACTRVQRISQREPDRQ